MCVVVVWCVCAVLGCGVVWRGAVRGVVWCLRCVILWWVGVLVCSVYVLMLLLLDGVKFMCVCVCVVSFCYGLCCVLFV